MIRSGKNSNLNNSFLKKQRPQLRDLCVASLPEHLPALTQSTQEVKQIIKYPIKH